MIDRIFTLGLLFPLMISTGTAAGTPTSEHMGFGPEQIPTLEQVRINGTSRRTVQLLLSAVESSQGPRRVQLVRDLGECQSTEAVSTLVRLLDDPSADVRAQAAISLAKIGDLSAREALSKHAKDPDHAARREILVAAADLGDINAISAGLCDPDMDVQEGACAAATTPAEVDTVEHALPSLPLFVRWRALQTLGTSKSLRHWRAAEVQLTSTTPLVCAALDALGKMHAPQEAASSIIPLLHDTRSVVRRGAMAALIQILSPDQQDKFALALLDDPDSSVRLEAVIAIRDAPTPAAVDPLLNQVGIDTPLRMASRDALVAIGSPSIPSAIAWLTDTNPERREDGSYILGRLCSASALSKHIALLGDPDWNVVAQAARSLGQIGEIQAGPALLDVARKLPKLMSDVQQGPTDEQINAVMSATAAAADLGYRPILQTALPLIGDQSAPPEIRAASIYAYGLLGNPADSDTIGKLLGIYYDRYQAYRMKIEALKALGNVRAEGVAEQLKKIGETENNLQFRWLAHWAFDQIVGHTTPLLIPPLEWTAQVSITELAEGATDRTLNGVLDPGPAYLPGFWTPIRLRFQNGGNDPIRGYASLTMSVAGSAATLRVPGVVPEHSMVELPVLGLFGGPQGPSGNRISDLEWYSENGQRISRGEILGAQLGPKQGFVAGSGTLLLHIEDADESESSRNPANNAAEFAVQLTQKSDLSIHAQSINVIDAPRHAAGYDAYQYVLLSADPNRFDVAQRSALLAYLNCGGTLLVCGRYFPSSSWLDSYFPVFTVGTREISAVSGHEYSVHFTAPLQIVEATDPAGGEVNILLHDGQLIYAADRPLGLGRVVFTSFPLNAVDPSDDNFVPLWRNVLQWNRLPGRAKPQSLEPIIDQMVGFPTVPFSKAALVVGGYIVLALVLQLLSSARARPRSYAWTMGVAILGFCGLLVASARSTGNEIHGASVSVMEFGTGGSGVERQYLAFIGADDPSFGLTARGQAMLAPVVSTDSEAVELNEFPMAANRAGAHAKQIRHIWRASDTMAQNRQLKASARFTDAGLQLHVQNDMGQSIHSPILLWGPAFALADIPTGATSPVILRRNSNGDYTNTGVFQTQAERLRGDIITSIQKSMDRGPGTTAPLPVVLGWLDEPSSLVDTTRTATMESQTLVNVPLRLQPSQTGSKVIIDGGFCSLIRSAAKGIPYDAVRREWVQSNQVGQWLIGFAPPAGIGNLRPSKVLLKADVMAPTQTISVVRGQCIGGKAKENEMGEVVAAWQQPIAPHEIAFDCKPGDFDGQGRVWLLLRVESTAATPSVWFIRQRELSYSAICVGPTTLR